MNNIEVDRALYNPLYHQYFENKDCLNRNNSFVAKKEGEVVAICDFEFTSPSEVKVVNITDTSYIKAFIDEFLYWNPYIQQIITDDKTYHFQPKTSISKIDILDVTVEQLTVSQEKLDSVMNWINKEDDVIIRTINLDNKKVCIDGYTRLLAAYLKGFKYVYCFNEVDPYDEMDYKEFRSWCEQENIHTIKDLENRIVSREDHQKLWIDKCQNYFRNKRK